MQVRRGGLAGHVPEMVLCLGMFVSAGAAHAGAVHAGATAAAPSLQILSYEAFRPLPAAQPPGSAKQKSNSLRTLKFDAHGRHFTLLLDINSRLTPPPPAEGPTLTLYQGTIDNVPDSWVRLSAKAQEIRGAVWDGKELYLIDSSAVLGTDATATETIIFRLSDTQVPAGHTFCGDTPAQTGTSGKAAYSELLSELKNSPVIMRAPGAAMRLEISALADQLFRARYASDRQAQDAILSRINIIDGIYSSQLHVEIQVPTYNINDAVASQLSATTSPNTLIEEVGLLRERTPVLRARGLTHLFTGRDLEGQTVGIAYTASLCSRRYGAGLTQASGAVTIDALVAAHEIGHNFGAPHDGENECEATPQNQFLMSPSVSTNATTFSQCSLAQIQPRLAAATCLLPLTPPDLAVPVDLGSTNHAVSVPFTWELEVANQGGSIAYDSDVTLWVPPVITIMDAIVVGGTCTSGAGQIHCEMGDIPAAGTRVVQLTLRSDVIGSNSISARVNAPSDSESSNNAGDGSLVIDPEADLAVTTQAPASVTAGTTLTASFTAANSASIDVANVQIELSLTGGVTVAAADVAGGTCTVADTSAHCSLPTLAANQSLSGALTLTAGAAGAASLRASIAGDYIDPSSTNNASEQIISVISAPVQSTPRRGGGGGATSLTLLLGLFSLLGLRRLTRLH